ncbi:MAG: iron ABC transporter permease [Planctomycetota bacterium]
MKKRRPVVAAALMLVVLALLVPAVAGSLMAGPTRIAAPDVWNALTGRAHDAEHVLIVRDLRLPRIVLALVVGSSLAVAGAIMQGVTRNPLASPTIAGLTGGGTLGLLLAMLWLPQAGQLGMIAASFLGALVAVLSVYAIGARARAGLDAERLALAGLMISVLCGSVTAMLVFEYDMVTALLSWLLGGLANLAWPQVWPLLPVFALGMLLALALSPQITVLNLGADVARGLGQRTQLVVFGSLAAVLLLAGGAISVAGPIAFVGLFVPHLVRFAVGYDYRFVVPLSALVGSLFLLVADTICRSATQGVFEIPVGLLTTLIGLPFFLVLARAATGRGELS